MSHLPPTVGSWYRNLEDNRLFEIVAQDSDDETIGIQYFDSEIEELDLETWRELSLELTAAPEDWTGPYDDLVADDMGDTEEPMRPENWSGPISDID